MKKLFEVTEVRFENEFIIIMVDGRLIKLKVSDVSQRLANASKEEKLEYIVSPSGYGIHWPRIDEDLSIFGLLKMHQA